MSYAALLPAIKEIAREASRVVMHYYEEGPRVETKPDASPVTDADVAANVLIVDRLHKLAPEIPVIAEENDENAALADGEAAFFLVDPLDGTKSFIKRTGEFTVNIALIEKRMPRLGVVTVPARGLLYYGSEGGGAFRIDGGHAPEQIHARPQPGEGADVVTSQFHRGGATEAFLKTLHVRQAVAASSSVKFCVIAEGKADIYPRFGRTMEWDTAAGHAVVLAAGGSVLTEDGMPLAYGKPGFENPNFIAYGKK